ncbi:MAG: hypothetical protein ACI8RA_001966, partial [Chlamydiales bacterium]
RCCQRFLRAFCHDINFVEDLLSLKVYEIKF